MLIEHHLEFLSLKGGYTGSSESTLVKMSHCWKLHVAAHLLSYRVSFEDTLCEHNASHRKARPGFKIIKLFSYSNST